MTRFANWPKRIGNAHILWCIIWAPTEKGDLAATAFAAVEIILYIVDSIAPTNTFLATAVEAFSVKQLLAKYVVISNLRSLLYNDLLPVITNLIDNPLCILAQFEFIKCSYAFGCNGNTT
jgi:hypothetical protein